MEVICFCVSFFEVLIVVICRLFDLGGLFLRKVVLLMNGLSYGVIRVDIEEKLLVFIV